MQPRTAVLVGGAIALALALPLIVLMVFARVMLAPGPGNANNNAFAFAGGAPMPIEMFGEAAPAPAQPVDREQLAELRGEAVPAGEYKVSAPATHANLSVYFVHGPNTMPARRMLTLQQALNENLAVVHEGVLSIDNRSDMPLFIQGGDIVKGGTQDRVLPYDAIIAAGASRAPVAAFCVEQGRSFPRGQEMSAAFETASEQLPTRQLKLAALHQKSQMAVWSAVSQTQANLARNIGAPVQAQLSTTSLQLTIEHPRVQQAAAEYLQNLGQAGADDDVLGVVVAVNGKIESADVYASADLFRTLWPKLLRAGAIAALAERGGPVAEPPTPDAVRAFLTSAEQGRTSRQDTAGRQRLLRHETATSLLIETCDAGQENLVVHRCYLAK